MISSPPTLIFGHQLVKSSQTPLKSCRASKYTKSKLPSFTVPAASDDHIGRMRYRLLSACLEDLREADDDDDDDVVPDVVPLESSAREPRNSLTKIPCSTLCCRVARVFSFPLPTICSHRSWVFPALFSHSTFVLLPLFPLAALSFSIRRTYASGVCSKARFFSAVCRCPCIDNEGRLAISTYLQCLEIGDINIPSVFNL
jgi:hypothetical protein